MNEYEKVEKLREKANVSYEEARAALEASNWDLLDAIVLLEREGKLNDDGAAHHSTKSETATEPEPERRSRFAERATTLGKQIRRLIQIGNENSFSIHYKGSVVLNLPMTAMVLLLILMNAWLLVILVGGLFFGLRYSLHGEQLGNPQVNEAMDKAANAAENVRETVEDSLKK